MFFEEYGINESSMNPVFFKNVMNEVFSPLKFDETRNYYDLISFEEKSLPKTNQSSKDENDSNKNFFSFDKIKQILLNKNLDTNIKNLLEKNTVIEADDYLELSENFLNRKRKRENFTDQEPELEKIVDKRENLRKKRGRKPKKNTGSSHNKYAKDNIIKKIKVKILNSCLEFLNKLLKRKENNRLLKLDYNQFINETSRKFNLNLINMTLREIFSSEISPKYKEKSKGIPYNKNIIENIADEVDDSFTVNYSLNMTLRNYFDIFLCKKNVRDLIGDDSNINDKRIEECAGGLEKMLGEMYKEKNFDEKYFCLFLLYLYNFERYYLLKKGREVKKKRKNEEILES